MTPIPPITPMTPPLSTISYESSKRVFESWNAHVIAKCPKDRLLVFDVRQGWEPLCKFLGEFMTTKNPRILQPKNSKQSLRTYHKESLSSLWQRIQEPYNLRTYNKQSLITQHTKLQLFPQFDFNYISNSFANYYCFRETHS